MAFSWLLQYLPEYRALWTELEELRGNYATLLTEKLRLQDRLDATVEDRTKLWDTMQECLRGERASYQMHVNQSWQRMGAGVPYPDAPHMAASASAEGGAIGRKGPVLPSEAVAKRTEQFVNSLIGKG